MWSAQEQVCPGAWLPRGRGATPRWDSCPCKHPGEQSPDLQEQQRAVGTSGKLVNSRERLSRGWSGQQAEEPGAG